MNNRKTRFVEILTALKAQWEYDISHVEKLEVVYGNESIEPYNTSFLVDSLISELCYLVGGNTEYIKTEICRFMYDLSFGDIKGGEYKSAEDLYYKLLGISAENHIEKELMFKPRGKYWNRDKTESAYLYPPKSEEENNPTVVEEVMAELSKWGNNSKLHPSQRSPLKSMNEFIESISKKYIIKKREE